MKFLFLLLMFSLMVACVQKPAKKDLDFKVVLEDPLTEISGIKADGNDIWAITDKPHAVAYKINKQGAILQTVLVKNIEAVDVEAVTADSNFVYIGDVGDNDGTRQERQIIKFSKAGAGTGKSPEVNGELITFQFENEQLSDNKKENNYDCESLLSMGDSLYLFTKRRGDHQCELFVLPKTAGHYTARSLGMFDTHGLITDASINPQQNEVTLCGYNKGHQFPFFIILKNFTGNHFFSGQQQRIELANKPWDWQIEGVTYTADNKIYFSCEETPEVPSTLYGIKKANLFKLNKKGK